jgi:hypothetical protein
VIEAYADVPLCPCGGPLVGVEIAHWNHRAKLFDRLVCCACGQGRHGTEEEYKKSQKADAAWLMARAAGEL